MARFFVCSQGTNNKLVGTEADKGSQRITHLLKRSEGYWIGAVEQTCSDIKDIARDAINEFFENSAGYALLSILTLVSQILDLTFCALSVPDDILPLSFKRRLGTSIFLDTNFIFGTS